MAILRVEKTRDYTIMSNHHLKSKNLSLKAKGLLSVILSLPDGWTFSLKGLAAICVEGVDTIRRSVAELEREGYIVRSRVRDEKGCLRKAEYVIYEHPRGWVTSSADAAPIQGLADEAEAPEAFTAKTCPQEALMAEPPALDSLTFAQPALENAMLGKLTQSITNRSNTYPNNNTVVSNPHQSNLPEGDEEERMGWKRDGLTPADSFQVDVLKRIEYDVLSQDAHIDQGRLDEIVCIMLEVLCATNQTMPIAGNEYPTTLVQERFRQITSQHIQYVFHCLNKNTSQIRNIKKYLLAVLFNAPVTMDGYYAALLNHNLGSIVSDAFDPDLDELPGVLGDA